MILSKRFRFEAAHRLPRYKGPCFDLHGHSYELHVSLEMPVDADTGMTLDFFRLEAAVREKVLDRLDHKNINDLWIWEVLKPHFPEMVEVKLFETADSSVTYRGK
ncbi:MAG: 6-carboxytetrahydropterin synthase QueD [Acidobacteria bacterium]|nr:MAG: 6-carboxytetrahydropterin synthase QueD [Acidobacteriota bacterium]